MNPSPRRQRIPTMAALLLVTAMVALLAPGASINAVPLAIPSAPLDCAPEDASNDGDPPTSLSPPVHCLESLGAGDDKDHFEIRAVAPPAGDPNARMKVIITATPASPGLDLGICAMFATHNVPCDNTAPNAPAAIIELEAYTIVEFVVFRIAGEGPYTLSVVTDGWTSTMSCATPPEASIVLPPGTPVSHLPAMLAGAPNDCFDDAMEVSAPATVPFHTTSATLEPGERICDGFGSRSVWFRFTPTHSGNYYASVTDGLPDSVGVYTGTGIDDLAQVACTNWNQIISTASRGASWYGEAGTTYNVQVVTSYETSYRLFLNGGPEDHCVAPPSVAPPTNDCYKDAAVVTSPSQTHWTLDGSTLQPGEWSVGPPSDYPVDGTLWFEFTPEARARYDIRALGEEYTSFTLYESLGPDGLGQAWQRAYKPTWGAGLDGPSGPEEASAWHTLQAGTTYRIQVSEHRAPNVLWAGPVGYYHPALEPEPRGYAMGDLTLTLTGGGVPCGVIPNDCFNDATTITLGSQTIGNNVNAGIETEEPLNCWTTVASNYASVWYRYDAVEDGRVMADLVGSDINFFLNAYTGTQLDSLEPARAWPRCTDVDDGQYGTGGFEWDATAGETYWIQVSGRPGAGFLAPPASGLRPPLPAEGNITLNLHRANGECSAGAPPNDCVASALPLATDDTLNGSNVGGRAQGNEHFPCNMGLETLWYRVVADAEGPMTVDTFGSDFDTVLAVYEADEWRDSPLTCNGNADGTPQSKITWTVEAGQAYLIQVGGYEGATGDLSISLD